MAPRRPTLDAGRVMRGQPSIEEEQRPPFPQDTGPSAHRPLTHWPADDDETSYVRSQVQAKGPGRSLLRCVEIESSARTT